MNDEPADPSDELLARLAALPPCAPPPEISARLLRRPRAIFAREAARRERPLLGALGRAYGRAEPALAAVVVVVYLGWALRTALALL